MAESTANPVLGRREGSPEAAALTRGATLIQGWIRQGQAALDRKSSVRVPAAWRVPAFIGVGALTAAWIGVTVAAAAEQGWSLASLIPLAFLIVPGAVLFAAYRLLRPDQDAETDVEAALAAARALAERSGYEARPLAGIQAPRLVLRFWLVPNSEVTGVYELAEGLNLVGREASCSILLEHASIAAIHCALAVHRGAVVVSSLNPGASVTVNGETAMERMLGPGDVMQIGAIPARIEVA